MCIGIGAVVIISRSGYINWPLIGSLFFNPEIGLVLLVLTGLNLFCQSFRWWLIAVHALGPNSLKTKMQYTLIGSFFNFVFPSSIGGDVLRGYYLAQEHSERKMRAALTVILDRFIGLYSMILMSAFFLCLSGSSEAVSESATMTSLRTSIYLMFFAYTLLLILLATGQLIKAIYFLDKIFSNIKFLSRLKIKSNFVVGTHDCLREFILDYKLVVSTFFVGVFSQCLVVVFFYWIAYETGTSAATFWQLMSVVPIGFLFMAIPISPGGIGVGQVAYLFLMRQIVGENSDFGPTAISAFQLSLLAWSLIGGWYYLTLKKPKEVEESNG